MIGLVGLLLSVAAAGSTSAPAVPANHVLGKGVECQQGYFALTTTLIRGHHYLQEPDSNGHLYTTFFSPDDHTVWRFTLDGNPAHPAVAVLNTGPKGVSLKGACGFGDGPSFRRFVEDFELTQSRRGR